jgi:hypothetical protein
MAGLFKRLFDGHQDNRAQAAAAPGVGQGLDLQAAMAAHRNWKLRLDAYLAGHSTEDMRAEHICFDDRCDFGKWVHGPGKAALGHVPGFQRLVADHRMFHYAASNVVALFKAGKIGEALTMLEGPYEAASRRVIAALGEMQAQGARPAEPGKRMLDFDAFKRQLVHGFTEMTGPTGDAMALRLEHADDPKTLGALLPAAVQFVIGVRGASAGSDFRRRFATALAA